MKIRLSALALCAMAGALASPALAFDMPARKPGLWEIHSGDASGKTPAATMQQCIDAASDKAMQDRAQGMAQSLGKDACSQDVRAQNGSQITIDSVCKLGTTTATTHTVVSGDFNSAYRMDRKASYNPPLMGRAESATTMEAKWIGPCKADQKPGDMVMPNGTKVNMLEMMAGRPKK
jgi:hypothetical protein